MQGLIITTLKELHFINLLSLLFINSHRLILIRSEFFNLISYIKIKKSFYFIFIFIMEIDSGVMAALGGSTTWGEGHHSLCHHHFRLQYGDVCERGLTKFLERSVTTLHAKAKARAIMCSAVSITRASMT